MKPGKGHAFVRTKLKNVRTGAVLERTMRSGEKMERAIVDKNEMSMLYRDGADFVFMDSNTCLLYTSLSTLGGVELLVGVSAEVFTWWTDLDAPLDAMSAAALDQLGRER